MSACYCYNIFKNDEWICTPGCLFSLVEFNRYFLHSKETRVGP